MRDAVEHFRDALHVAAPRIETTLELAKVYVRLDLPTNALESYDAAIAAFGHRYVRFCVLLIDYGGKVVFGSHMHTHPLDHFTTVQTFTS